MPRRKTSTSFKPGQSGNPGGRRKSEICLTNLLRAALAEHDADGKRTKARAVIDALIEMALEHDGPAIGRIFDRIDGILQPIKTEVLDIRALIDEVAKRAELRKRVREAD